ncbi:MAG: PspC domain-containing protein [Coriobacteriia bacterium]
MTDTNLTGGKPTGEHDNSGWVILGVILVVAGFFLGAHNLGLIPWQMTEAWRWFGRARGGVGVLLVGIALIVWAQSGRRISMPRTSGKLLRSRSDKWVAGVLGGLGAHFGVDSTILRLAFIALVVLFDIGGLVVAYIIMAIVVPLEPQQVAVAPAPPAVYTPAAPPAEPASPAPPVSE